MTTIIYRKGTMVGDGMVQQSYVKCHNTQKVFKLDNGALVGVAGQMNQCQAFVRHLVDPDHVPLYPIDQMHAIVVYPDDPELIYEFAWDNIPCTFRSDCASVGSGSKIALGLMRATNITAMAAMKVVADLDVNTGPPFTSESFSRRRQHDFAWLTRMPFHPATLKPISYVAEEDEDEDEDANDTKQTPQL